MRNALLSVFILIIVIFAGQQTFAQQYAKDTVISITLENGQFFKGKVIKQDEDILLFETMDGERYNIPKKDILGNKYYRKISDTTNSLKMTNIENNSSPGTAKNDTNITNKIVLTDGTEINGKIIYQDYKTMKIMTISGIEMTLPMDKIKEIKAITGEMINGEFWKFDPNRTRLFFAPTARPLNAGEGYFSVYEIFFPMISIGVTDFLAISGGMSLFPGADEQLLYANLKVTPVHTDGFSLSVGTFYFHIMDSYAGILYGVGTVGNSKYSLSAGLGFGYSEDGFTDTPFLMLGGDLRLGNSIKLISENWIVSDVGMFSLGLRFFGDNVAADFALMSSTAIFDEGVGFPFLPWIGFAYNFGR